MREIKFRAWDTKLKMWVYGVNDFQYKSGVPNLNMSAFFLRCGNGVFDKKTLCQFTGLISEDPEIGTGQEVYTGDIFEVTDGDGWVVGKHLAKMDSETLSIDPRTIGKVIGNSHQNKDLL